MDVELRYFELPMLNKKGNLVHVDWPFVLPDELVAWRSYLNIFGALVLRFGLILLTFLVNLQEYPS